MGEGHNVILATFEDDGKAYEALSRLRQANRAGRVDVMSAAVLERGLDGRVSIPEAADAVIGTGAAGGGLIGLLVGILGGPVGVVLGFGGGVIAGSYFDVRRGETEGDVLGLVAETLPPGCSALVADINEYAVEVIDGETSALGGTVVRFPAAEMLAALESAEKAAEAAEHEARRVMRDQRKERSRARLHQIEVQWDERVDALKQKLEM